MVFLLQAGDFGVTTNPDTILHQSFQFDFYDGGGLDIAFLGLAQCDSHGNINVSKFGPKIAGCGGFINNTQNTPVVVFCGTFTVKGKNKFLKDVEQITFSADFANKTGQKVLYVTECCVFKLTKEGVELIEVAPGLDMRKISLLIWTSNLSSKMLRLWMKESSKMSSWVLLNNQPYITV